MIERTKHPSSRDYSSSHARPSVVVALAGIASADPVDSTVAGVGRSLAAVEGSRLRSY